MGAKYHLIFCRVYTLHIAPYASVEIIFDGRAENGIKKTTFPASGKWFFCHSNSVMVLCSQVF
jgi:hypothetical protein